MTTQHTDEMREAFEQWGPSYYIVFPDTFKRGDDGEYLNNEVAHSYLSWQAATASAEEKYLPVIEKLVEALTQCVEYVDRQAFNVGGPINIQRWNTKEDALALATPLLKGEK